MDQLQDTESILESKVTKETYVLRSRRQFRNTKHFTIKRRFHEDENELNRRVFTLLKKFGVIKEDQR